MASGKQPCRGTSHGRNPPTDYKIHLLGDFDLPEGEGQLENSAPGSQRGKNEGHSKRGHSLRCPSVQASRCWEVSASQGSLLCPLQPPPPLSTPCTWPLETTSLPSFSKISSFQKCLNGILRCGTFWGWLCKPGRIPWRFTKFVFISICILFNVKAAAHSRTNQWTKTWAPVLVSRRPSLLLPLPDNTYLDSEDALLSCSRTPDTDEHTLYAEQQFCSPEAVTPRPPASLEWRRHPCSTRVRTCGGLFPVSESAHLPGSCRHVLVTGCLASGPLHMRVYHTCSHVQMSILQHQKRTGSHCKVNLPFPGAWLYSTEGTGMGNPAEPFERCSGSVVIQCVFLSRCQQLQGTSRSQVQPVHPLVVSSKILQRLQKSI